jgi:hypothetical protein
MWEQVAAFSGYGFNQGHATAYAAVSYRMAYIKARWPAALFCARLEHWGGFHHPAMYAAEAVRLGIAVRPPHVNASGQGFTLAWEDGDPVLWMGLGRVRDLRRSAVRTIVAERERQLFTCLADLQRRVPLQRKEVVHLIRCGALDGLGASRAALLAEAEEIDRAGSARQLHLFGAEMLDWGGVTPEGREQQWAWEHQLLGMPIGALGEPLAPVGARLPEHVPLARLPETGGRTVATAGVRLPGWTGGEGFHLWDGATWVVARMGKGHRSPRPWEPLLVRGRWAGDGWGTWWLQVVELIGLQGGSACPKE